MSKRFLNVMLVVGFSTVIILSPGCGRRLTSLVDQGVVSIETESCEDVRILWGDVYQDNVGVVIYGVLQRRHYGSSPLQAHVHVTLLSSEGRKVQEIQTPDIWVPRRLPGKGFDSGSFQVRTTTELIEASTIKMDVHTEPHRGQNSCEGRSKSAPPGGLDLAV